jgi:hypothetical protein
MSENPPGSGTPPAPPTPPPADASAPTADASAPADPAAAAATPDLSKIDLFPTSVLQPIADAGTPPQQQTQTRPPPGANVVRVPGWLTSQDVQLDGPFDFPQPQQQKEVDDNRASWLGPTYAGLAFPPGDAGSFQDHLTAEAALAMLPAALIGAVARPAVDYIYKLIDYIPEALRRPFEKAFGLLIDNAMSAVTAVDMPLVDASVDKFYPGGAGLPQSAQVKIQAYSQTEFSCAETAAASILKATGEPVSLADVDTQLPFVSGTSGFVDQEFKRRGLSLITGPGDMNKLKAFLANQYPVMISVGWESGGGHMVVVTGYNEANKTVTINNYDAEGGVYNVPYDEFMANWNRHLDYMTVVVPQRDTRLTNLNKQGDLRRPDQIYEGLTLSDFYVNQDGQVFVEGAYRFCTPYTDITVRVNFDQSEVGLERQFNGSLAIKQQLATGWYLGLTVEKLSLRGKDDNWSSFATAPVSIYGTLKAPGFEIKAGTEHGAFQASIAADLGKFIAGLGMNVNFSMDEDKTWRLYATLTGTF